LGVILFILLFKINDVNVVNDVTIYIIDKHIKILIIVI